MALQQLGFYTLQERIGVGGLGNVYRAVHRDSGETVALKRLTPAASDDEEVVETLQQEADVARALDHPCIAKVCDVGEVSGVHYIAYEYVHGPDLRAVINRAAERRAPVPVGFAVYVGLCVAEGLGHAHARERDGRPLGLVHRDVNPTNILVSLEGDVKLTDFGIASAAGRVTRTGAGQVRGTLGYFSPEQLAGDTLDARTDLYSLGVVLWEMLTGQRLYEGPVETLIGQIGRRPVQPPSALVADIPKNLDALVVKMLAVSPRERYAKAEDFRSALLEVARHSDRVFDRSQVALYLRDLFPEVASLEESLNMADDKGGSDLDVFEGLAKKSSRPAAVTPASPTPSAGAPPAPPPSARPPARHAGTLIGPTATPLPPPPRSGSSPNLGGPPAPLPPPSGKPRVGASTLAGVGQLPAVTPPPSGRKGGPPTPRSGAGAPPPLSKPPSLPAPTPPPKPAQSVGSALGFGSDGAPQSSRPAAIDMDWDDDEESTHVYDKAAHKVPGSAGPRPAAGAPPSKVGAAAALLASSGGTAAPASVRPPSIPAPAKPPAPKSSRPPAPQSVPARSRAADEPTSIRRMERPSGGGSKIGVVLAALALLGVIGLAVFMFMPRTGEFKINVQSKSGSSVARAEIFVDGQKVCDTAPCVARNLEPGPRTIKVIVPGAGAVPPLTETVVAGKETAVLVEVDDSEGGDEEVAGTGFKASSKQAGIKVFVDGKERGTMPAAITDLPPGEHEIRFEAGPKYKPLKKTIDVEDGKIEDLGDIALVVLKGDLVLELKTAGAKVKLISSGAKKVEKRLPDSLWKSPPVKLEDLDAKLTWTIVATKKGYDDFEEAVKFDDGEAEKTLVIELAKEGEAEKEPDTSTPEPGPVAVGPGPGPGPGPAAPPPPPPPAGGNGTLNINSIPVSKVLLDGRPLGSTPKVGISVPPGSHTVTFIHPEKGRKSVSVNVPAGKTKTAAVKF